METSDKKEKAKPDVKEAMETAMQDFDKLFES
jgi:hypothetical protein